MKYWNYYAFILLAYLAASCTNSPTAPTSSSPAEGLVSPPGVGDSVGEQGSGETEADLKGCEVLSVEARRVLEVRPGLVTLRVLARYAGTGTPYVRIINAASGSKIGDFGLGDISLRLPAGFYRLLVFVEVRDERGFFQCDGSLEVTVPEHPPEPPPEQPKPPEEPPVDPPEEPPAPEPPTPEGCELPELGGPFPQQGNPRSECSYFGAYVPTEESGDFYICKAGRDMYTAAAPIWKETCPNGKDISHITACVCEEE